MGQIRIAIDAKTSDPLRVKVFARNGSKPAFEVTYTSLTYSAPPASVFNFSPPPGATVTQGAMAPRLGDGQRKLESPAEQPAPAQTSRGSYVVGTGWTTVRVMTSVNLSAIGGNADARTLLDAAQPVKGAFGSGRLLRTALVSVLSLDDGRILVGAVTPAVLEQAATQPAPTR